MISICRCPLSIAFVKAVVVSVPKSHIDSSTQVFGAQFSDTDPSILILGGQGLNTDASGVDPSIQTSGVKVAYLDPLRSVFCGWGR